MIKGAIVLDMRMLCPTYPLVSMQLSGLLGHEASDEGVLIGRGFFLAGKGDLSGKRSLGRAGFFVTERGGSRDVLAAVGNLVVNRRRLNREEYLSSNGWWMIKLCSQ